MSYFDEELEKELLESSINYMKLNNDAHDNAVSHINGNFPFIGSKIAWSSLPNSTSHSKNTINKAIEEISEKAKDLKITEITFIGDSLTENAYKFHTADLKKIIMTFSEIPQHTYFFSEQFSLIGCISSEGEINFSATT